MCVLTNGRSSYIPCNFMKNSCMYVFHLGESLLTHGSLRSRLFKDW